MHDMSGVVKDVGAFWKMTATPVIQRSIASIHVKFKQLRKGYGAQVEGPWGGNLLERPEKNPLLQSPVTAKT